MNSSAFDAFLEVEAPDGRRYSDDDKGGGRNSLIRLQCSGGGTLRVRARSLNANHTGSYELNVVID